MRPNLSEDTTASCKTHEEINQLLEEIKEFENRYKEFDFKKIEIEEEIVEVKEPKIEEKVIVEKHTPKKSKIKDKLGKLKINRNPLKEKIVEPATFKLRFNEMGKLENIDIKKFEPKKSTKKLFNFRKKKTKNDGAEVKENTSKFSKLKGSLGKIAKIKKIIPSRSKSSEVKEETKDEV